MPMGKGKDAANRAEAGNPTLSNTAGPGAARAEAGNPALSKTTGPGAARADAADGAEEYDEERKKTQTSLVPAGPEPAAPEPERPVGEPNAQRTGDRARGSGGDSIQYIVTTTALWKDHPSTLSPSISSQIISKTKSELDMNIEGAPEAQKGTPH